MENKENYYKTLTDLSSTIDQNVFYENLTSTNVISVEDTNELLSSINFCVDTLSALCTTDFCQLCENTYNYYIKLTDQVFPRVKYYNEKTTAVSAIFSNSKINNIPLSSTPSLAINLLTYPKNGTFDLVSSINCHTGNISGVERIIINGDIFQWSQTNRGKINLGSFKTTMGTYLTSVNNVGGVLEGMPTGIKYNGVVKSCDQTGLVDVSNIFNDYMISSNLRFTNLYVNTVKQNNPKSVINKRYITDHLNPLKIKSKTITVETVGSDGKTAINISLVNDSNFLAYIYGFQNNKQKRIDRYITDATLKYWEDNYYKNGIPLTIIPLENGILKLVKRSTPYTNTFSYSKNYLPYEALPESLQCVKGDVIAISGSNNHLSKDENSYYYFTFKNGSNNASFACYGNIMSLVNWDTEIRDPYQFYWLFGTTKIVKAPQLPATILKASCYKQMFTACDSLIVPPSVLPATELAENCYRQMFNQCSTLSTVPRLEATTTAASCCLGMFSHCTRITVPYYYLKATTLTDSCYQGMFSSCDKLLDSPLLSATTLAPNCYKQMFRNTNYISAVHINASVMGSDFNTYAQDWLTKSGTSYVSDPTIYNTEAWNYFNSLSGEYFYYSNNNNIITNFPITYKIARSLEDTPFSIEVAPGTKTVYDGNGNARGNRFCFRTYKKVFKNGAVSGYDFFCYKNHPVKGNDVARLMADMNPQYKYYGKNTCLCTSMSRDWTSMSAGFQHNGTDAGGNLTRMCSGFAPQKLNNDPQYNRHWTSGKIGQICSFKCNQMGEGLISGDTTNGILQFWNFRLHYGLRMKVMGNISSLVGGRNYLKPYQLYGLFKERDEIKNKYLKGGSGDHTTYWTDAHQLILPFKNLSEECYGDMFDSCSSLLSAGPTNLPATEVPERAYRNMFRNCFVLTSMPYIDGTSFSDYSCDHMFESCSALVASAPIYDIEVTALSCFSNMFSHCNNMLYYPDMKTNIVESGACYCMFEGCKNLKYPPSLNFTTLKAYSCHNMFYENSLAYTPAITVQNVQTRSFSQTFYKNVNLNHCYLPFSELAPSSCYRMFYNCSGLKTLAVHFSDWGPTYTTHEWVYSVSSQGTFYCPETLTRQNGITYIPSRWTVSSNTNTTNLIFKDNISTGEIKLFYLTK